MGNLENPLQLLPVRFGLSHRQRGWALFFLFAAFFIFGTIRAQLSNLAGGDHRYLFFFIPLIIAVCILSGWRFVLVTGLACLIYSELLSPPVWPPRHMTLPHWITVVVFVLTVFSIAIGGTLMQRTERAAILAADQAMDREKRLNAIISTIRDGIIIIDKNAIIQSFSEAAEGLFGYSAQEVIGKSLTVLMPEPMRSQHHNYMQHYFDTGEKRVIGKIRFVPGLRKDGTQFPIELTVGVLNSNGETYFIGFVRDLTEAEANRKRMQDMQAELIHISRLSMLGEMGSALAHELNQPLSAIANYMKGSARLLEAPEPDLSKIRDALTSAGDQALRAGDIIRHLREFVGKGEAALKPENLHQLIEDTGALALVGLSDNGVHLTYKLSPKTKTVMADKVQIQQVLLNLIRNAYESMRDSQKRDLVVSTNLQKSGEIVISVADTGPGLDPEIVNRLFQPFVSTKTESMGVGLSICRTIVEAHGGTIWFETAPEGGAIFKFTLRKPPEGIDGDQP